MSSDTTAIGRPEFEARMREAHARTDARLSGIEAELRVTNHKIDASVEVTKGLAADVKTLATEMRAAFSLERTERREQQRWGIGTTLACAFALAAIIVAVFAFWMQAHDFALAIIQAIRGAEL